MLGCITNDCATTTNFICLRGQPIVSILSHILTIPPSQSSKVKAGTLWSKNKEDLLKQLGELKTELGQLRIQKIASSGSKLNRMYD